MNLNNENIFWCKLIEIRVNLIYPPSHNFLIDNGPQIFAITSNGAYIFAIQYPLSLSIFSIFGFLDFFNLYKFHIYY